MKPKRRRLPLRHAVAAAGVAAIALVVATIPPGETPPVTPHAPAPDPAAPSPTPPIVKRIETPTPPAEAPPRVEVASPVRQVSGPGITPLPEAAAPPLRVAPPRRPEPPPPPIVQRRLGLVRMENTAEFSVGDIRVRLPGVAITGPDEICRDRAGVEWPCGRRALVGVRAVVRGKAVDCPLPDKVRRGAFVTDCSLAGADMAERLVASGWARALDREGALGIAERRAEAKGLGLHGAAVPIGVDPFPAPEDELPADRTTAPLAGGGEPAPAAPGAARGTGATP